MKRGSVKVVLYTGTGLLGCALSIIGSAPPTTYLKDTGNNAGPLAVTPARDQ